MEPDATHPCCASGPGKVERESSFGTNACFRSGLGTGKPPRDTILSGIRPGIFRTEMTAAVKEKYDSLIAEGLVPQRRWGVPEDVGKAAAALARGDFAYATGLVVELSGGMQIRRL